MRKAEKEIRRAFALMGGSAKDIDQNLRAFSKSANALSNERPNLIHKYDGKWVAVHDGRVAASGRNMKAVRDKVSRAGIPPERTIFRFIEKTRRTMIL